MFCCSEPVRAGTGSRPDPNHIGGSARGYQELSASSAIPITAELAGVQAVCLCIATAGPKCASAAPGADARPNDLAD